MSWRGAAGAAACDADASPHPHPPLRPLSRRRSLRESIKAHQGVEHLGSACTGSTMGARSPGVFILGTARAAPSWKRGAPPHRRRRHAPWSMKGAAAAGQRSVALWRRRMHSKTRSRMVGLARKMACGGVPALSFLHRSCRARSAYGSLCEHLQQAHPEGVDIRLRRHLCSSSNSSSAMNAGVPRISSPSSSACASPRRTWSTAPDRQSPSSTGEEGRRGREGGRQGKERVEGMSACRRVSPRRVPW